MYIDGVLYENHKVKSVKLDLDTCKITIQVIFSKGKMEVVKVKEYNFDTNCDVDINYYIKELNNILNV